MNCSLVLFLEALSDVVPDLKSEWSMTRVPLLPKFRRATSLAKNDGCLRTLHEQIVQGIVEAKPWSRGHALKHTQMQESAEMVGWIFMDSEKLPSLNGQYDPLAAEPLPTLLRN